VQSLEDNFEILYKTLYNLPISHRKELVSEGEKLSKKEKKVYRSGMVKLLFLMCYSRPGILNTIQELNK